MYKLKTPNATNKIDGCNRCYVVRYHNMNFMKMFYFFSFISVEKHRTFSLSFYN